MKQVSIDEFKAAFIRYRERVGKPWEKYWNEKLDYSHRPDVCYYLDGNEEDVDGGGLIIDKLLKNDNRIVMQFVSKDTMARITRVIEEAIEEAENNK
jgi:hypothetical protein